ncbi:MAG: hypothetical protein WCT12_29955, partial [Verrucomicrobiota bacterium]
ALSVAVQYVAEPLRVRHARGKDQCPPTANNLNGRPGYLVQIPLLLHHPRQLRTVTPSLPIRG